MQDALDTAAFTKKRIAPVIHKLLTSAIDNAKYVAGEQGIDLDVDDLYVKNATADDGPRMKRIRPAPMGRAYRYQRRLAHLTISVAERDGGSSSLVTKVEEPEAAPKATKGKAAKPAKKAAAAPAAEKKPAAKKTAAKKAAPKKSAKKAE